MCGSGCRATRDQIGGQQIYNAVTKDGVGTPEEFRSWLADRELLDEQLCDRVRGLSGPIGARRSRPDL
jgi:hypothetical protein